MPREHTVGIVTGLVLVASVIRSAAWTGPRATCEGHRPTRASCSTRRSSGEPTRSPARHAQL